MLRDENVKQQETTKTAIVLIAGSRASRSNDVPMSLMAMLYFDASRFNLYIWCTVHKCLIRHLLQLLPHQYETLHL